MTRISLLLSVSCLSTALLAGSAGAHDVWITTTGPDEARRAIVNYGHPHDRPPALADKIVEIVAITAGGQTSLLDGLTFAQSEGAPVVVSTPFDDRGHALLAARYDNGYWVKVSDTLYRNATRRSVPAAKDSLWSTKFTKTLTGAGAPWQTLVGHELELVPLSDPGEIKPGQSLQVRLLFLGKPLADAQIERGDGVTPMKEDDIPRFKTDADGLAAIPIAKGGPVLLAVDHRVTPSGTPEIASADLFNATLWFLVR